jgi:hypothetical protein
MKMLFAAILGIFLLAAPVLAGSQPIVHEIRSPSGKLLYKTKTTGNRTEVISPNGKLLWVLKDVGGLTEVRSPTGKLLYKVQSTNKMPMLPQGDN